MKNQLIYSLIGFVLGILIITSHLFWALSIYTLILGIIICFACIVHSNSLRKKLLNFGQGKVISSVLTLSYKFHFPIVVISFLILNPLLYFTGNYFTTEFGPLMASEAMLLIWLIPVVNQMRLKEIKYDESHLYAFNLLGKIDKVAFEDMISVNRRIGIDYFVVYKDRHGKMKRIHFMPSIWDNIGSLFGDPKCIRDLKSKL